MTNKVPFFDYPRVHLMDSPKYLDGLMDVLTRSDYILRADLESFESNLANFLGVSHVIGVGNGTDAIWLSLLAAGLQPEDEVIIPSHTYIATADAIKFVGARVVLADCDDDHLISIDSIIENISPRTKAVIAVNLNGRAAKLDEIKKLCDDNGFIFFEDNAQGLGAMLDNKPAGTYGLAGTLSFFPAKNLGCLGDGGAIITNDHNFAESLKMLRNHGRNSHGEVVRWGLNSRLDNIQANVLNSKLPFLNDSIALRRKYADIYHKGLSDIEFLKLPPKPDSDKRNFDSYQNYEIEADRREELRDYLNSQGVGTILPWAGKAVHQFGLDGLQFKSLKRTEDLFKKVLLLPMNPYLKVEEVDFIVSTIRDFYNK